MQCGVPPLTHGLVWGHLIRETGGDEDLISVLQKSIPCGIANAAKFFRLSPNRQRTI